MILETLCCVVLVLTQQPTSTVLEDGWPWIGVARPLIVDLDGDGTKEVVIRDGLGPSIYSPDGEVLVPTFTYQGVLVGIQAPARVGDVDGDGNQDIVLTAFSGGYSDYVFAIDHNRDDWRR